MNLRIPILLTALLSTLTFAEEKKLPIPDKPNSPCNQLHKAKDRNDLLRQLYKAGFKDDCIYDLSAKDLKQAFGIPVVEHRKYTDQEWKKRKKNPMLRYRDVESPINIYLLKFYDSSIYVMRPRKLVEAKKTLFPEDKFPDFLGKVSESKIDFTEGHHSFITFELMKSSYQPNLKGYIEAGTRYCWAYKNRKIGTEAYYTDKIFDMVFTKKRKEYNCFSRRTK